MQFSTGQSASVFPQLRARAVPPSYHIVRGRLIILPERTQVVGEASHLFVVTRGQTFPGKSKEPPAVDRRLQRDRVIKALLLSHSIFRAIP